MVDGRWYLNVNQTKLDSTFPAQRRMVDHLIYLRGGLYVFCLIQNQYKDAVLPTTAGEDDTLARELSCIVSNKKNVHGEVC